MKIRRPPDFVVYQKGEPYLNRWYIIPRNRFFNIYLHQFLQSDEDRALHDHPWWSLGMILKGEYWEHVPADPVAWNQGSRETLMIKRKAFRPVLRSARTIHRVQLKRSCGTKFCHCNEIPRCGLRPVWTIFITGPRIREWGFWCPQGWRHWEIFTANQPGESHKGQGCE